MDLVKDVFERPRSAKPLPPNQSVQAGQTGWRKSLWKSRAASRSTDSPEPDARGRGDDYKSIDEENRQRLALMTPQEIAAERAELEASLPPGLIERIRNAHLEDRGGKEDKGDREDKKVDKKEEKKEEKEKEDKEIDKNAESHNHASPEMHFPTQTQDLDINATDFNERLHDKYFPDLPANPASLAWMKPVTAQEDESSAYNPAQQSVLPIDIRFDFRGNIIPPSRSKTLPVSLGLHHHADSPGYAGYTIPELAHLARSSVPAQRAIAIQVLGRVLYRLGINSYGEYVGDTLWDIVDDLKVIDSLYESASDKVAHQGLKACAVEALWLWKSGGGRKRLTD